MRSARTYNHGVASALILDLDKSSETSNRYAPDAAAVQYLLGKLQQGMGDMKLAAVCYVEALRLNPFMWDAFEQLCETGNFSLEAKTCHI